MDVSSRHVDDLAVLRQLMVKESNAKQRDRYRAVVLALEGLIEPEIRRRLGRSRGFIQRWVYAYRDQGLSGLKCKKPHGQPPKLPRDREAEFKALLDQPGAPRRGRDLVAHLQKHFGATYSVRGALMLLHRLGYEPLKPRPVNPKKDPAAEAQWRERAPFLSQEIRETYPEKQIEIWFQDESRFGQKGCLSHVWALRGSRPIMPLQNEFEWVYLYGAANPETGESCALVLPWANTEMMQLHLKAISAQVGPHRHVILVLDNAGWHRSKKLQIPDNITLFPLPPYCPELNPIERLWHWLKEHEFSNRIYEDDRVLLNAVSDMWNTLEPERIKTICRCSWTHRN